MKKRVLMNLVFLAFVTAGAAFAPRVFAQSPTPDKLTFVEIGKTGYSVKKASDNISGAVVIPGTYNNKPVTLLTDSAFINCKNITGVTIPASVTGIGGKAFAGCEKLTSVTFGGSNTIMVMAGLNISFPGDLYTAYKAGGAGTYTRQAGGDNWKKGGATAGAPEPVYYTSLDRYWEGTSRLRIKISGNTAVLDWIGTDPTWQDAEKKGFVKVGDQYWRNIKSTGNLKWSGQKLGVRANKSSPNVATGTQWSNFTFTMSADGQTLTQNDGTVWTRFWVQ
jgi:hypothetical protein